MLSIPILTYHSQNVAGHDAADNDHVALAGDLEALHRAGYRFVSLDTVIDTLLRGDDPGPRHVALTFDDGCALDVRDLEWPGVGLQRSFLGIMEDFARLVPIEGAPHATVFVIASSAAREAIDTSSLFGKGWLGDDWWREAQAHPMLTIGSHSWDHNHPDLGPGPGGHDRGRFDSIDDHAGCLQQVVRAGAAIEARAGVWPSVFAYPYGQSSEYLRETFFPAFTHVHGCRAAVGTRAGTVTADSDVWNLPRYVCRRDWRSPEELIEVLNHGTAQP
jgi:peptidoglycan/xylan/chitin deacetylase (PgdA/CDA1 family)